MKNQFQAWRMLLMALAMLTASKSINADENQVVASQTIRVGIIGLDTSHATAFTKQLNNNPQDPTLHNCQVVAAYPQGSSKIESSYSRIPQYTADVEKLGVRIVKSIDDLVDDVDAILLETNDGTLHLEQALAVFPSGKPVFIDKPVASNLAEVIAIFKAAKKFDVKLFSSSSLRYTPAAQAIRNGKIGSVIGCDTYSPAKLEPSHIDLFWYGIHAVEPLFTCMGRGCQSVRCLSTKDVEVVVGQWENDRLGTIRGTRAGKHSYGGTAFGDKGITEVGPYSGYGPLLQEITRFFRTGVVPIDPEETIEIYAFMQAAHESKRAGGKAIELATVLSEAEAEATKLLKAAGL